MASIIVIFLQYCVLSIVRKFCQYPKLMPIFIRSTVRVYSHVIGGLKPSTRLISSLMIGHLAVLHTGSVQSLEGFKKKVLIFLKMTRNVTQRNTQQGI